MRATGGQAFPDTLCDFGTRTTVIVTVGSLLVVPGIIVLVGTAGLRSVVLEAGGSYGKIRLILFGFQFTGLLLVLYWPAKAALNHEACRVRDDLQPLPILSDPALRDKNETRSAIDIMLGAGTTPLQGFQARLLIAAPLITSLIGSIVTGD